MSTTSIQLPRATDRTMEGPRLRLDRSELIVEYDYETDGGTVEWSRIIFGEVLAVNYRDGTCFTADSVVGFREVRALTSSTFLTEVLDRWNESVGWQEWQKKRGGSSRFRHFTICFDDDGCLDVIAASCDVA
jgi:hypothetical protein